MKRQKEAKVVVFLKEIMLRRQRSLSQLAADLGLSHSTISRWLSNKDIPSIKSCLKLARYCNVPVYELLTITGHLPKLPNSSTANLPDFREYVRQKYPREIDEDIIIMIEDLIRRRRARRRGSRTPKMGI